MIVILLECYFHAVSVINLLTSMSWRSNSMRCEICICFYHEVCLMVLYIELLRLSWQFITSIVLVFRFLFFLFLFWLPFGPAFMCKFMSSCFVFYAVFGSSEHEFIQFACFNFWWLYFSTTALAWSSWF